MLKKAFETLAPAHESAQTTGRRILVVEDEPLAAATLSAYLERKGYRVSVAHNGSEAWRWVTENPVDLIITDWRMPQGGGDALIARLEAEGRRIPIIVTSGQWDALPPDAPDGGRITLRKPLDLRQVLASVERLLAA